jgi:hypothetical protein
MAGRPSQILEPHVAACVKLDPEDTRVYAIATAKVYKRVVVAPASSSRNAERSSELVPINTPTPMRSTVQSSMHLFIYKAGWEFEED